MFIYEFAALAAALTWAMTGLISAGPAAHLGAIAFNRVRMAMVFVMLAAYATVTGTWQTIGTDQLPAILASGFIGIFLGDTALFLTMNRMGPRRTAILFSLNAPMSVLLGWLFLGEYLPPSALIGALLTFAGVVLAIAYGKRRSQLHHWENVKGPLWAGILLGLAAALAQSIGSLIARPVMETGVDPVAVSALRVGTAALGLTLLMRLPLQRFQAANPLTWKVTSIVALSGLLGMGVGMTLILFALSGGEVGIVSTLSATTPALQLPLLWWRTKEVPAPGAWAGAILVIVGCALIFNG
ncbi:EamA family transporter [Stappia sp. GBMRC 2046]|uniref:EamA family transporter n=1 Tax=Stappia sediminis TaxID=2692190 RepID=A0A7X3LU20_9HYPH|nr:DMT family transporter [Stappia sediminis]MXN65106.1 EamA family transporter [Stappia sediminis]